MDFYVYVWTNLRNGMQYVGKGRGLRAQEHFRRRASGRTPLHLAMQTDEFSLRFEAKDLSEEEALSLERRTISSLGTKQPFGYNRTIGGQGGPLGAVRSLCTRKKIADKLRGRKPSPSAAAAYKNKWEDPELRALWSNERRRPHSEETKALLRSQRAGKPKTREHVLRQAEASRAAWQRKRDARAENK